MRAAIRWAGADLRTHRGQALSIVLATVGITVALLLSVSLLSYAADPWQRLFTETQGAHVWLRTTATADTASLSTLDGVTATAGPYRTVSLTALHGVDKAALELRAAQSQEPTVGRPRLTDGRWLDGRADDGVVLEESVAAALWARPGDTLTVRVGGTDRSLPVVGVAETAESPYAPGETPGAAWAPPSVVAALSTGSGEPGQTMGLRVANPADTQFVVQRAVTVLGAAQVVNVSTWRDARTDAEGDNHLLGVLIGFFGLGALLAAALAVTGAAGTRVLAQSRDISILKAIGFTPAQVVAAFLVQHVSLALVGVLLGAAITEWIGPLVPGVLGEAVSLWQTLPQHAWSLPVTSLGTVFVIACGTVLAAWRAGRLPAVPLARVQAAGRRRMSSAARIALRLRTPPSLVLGWRGVINRPVRSAGTALRLALSVLMITVALGTWATLNRFEHEPTRVGLAGTLTARPTSLDDGAAQRLLSASPGVAAVYPQVELDALAPGQTGTVTLRGVGTAAQPYPYAIASGRAPSGDDEAVAGQGLLDTLHLSVGQWTRLTVGGTPHILHIVGRSIETGHEGVVISTSFDTLRAQDASVLPDSYTLRLRDGVRADTVRGDLAAASHGRLEVRSIANPAVALAPARGVIVGLILVLGLIGLAELLTAVASEIRDHSRDLGAYRAVGLTPHQTIMTMTASVGLIVLAAAVTGTVVGGVVSDWLIDLQGRSSGVGAGIARTPAPAVALAVVALAVAGAVLVSLPLAARVVRERDWRDAIHAE